jgi:hypothetical protein
MICLFRDGAQGQMSQGCLWIKADRLSPCDNRLVRIDDETEREQRLIARGILVPPKKKLRSPLPPPAGNVSDQVMERLWREEREGR